MAITGASGLIGRHLRPVLRGRPTVLLGRRRPELERHESWALFDLGRPVHLPALPTESSLCHLAFAMADGDRNVDYTRHLIDAVNRCDSISHVVMLSSASVYGAATAGVIDEKTPLRPDTAYARTKATCDRAWLELLRPDCRLTVLRPTSVVAPDGSGIDALARDALQHPLRAAAKRMLQQRNTVHFVAVGNVVAAVYFALHRPGSAREVFVVSDDDAAENASYAAMQDFVRAQFGQKPLRTPPLPRPFERPLGAALGKPLGVRRAFSTGQLVDAGFVRTTRLGDEVARTVRERFPQTFPGRPR